MPALLMYSVSFLCTVRTADGDLFALYAWDIWRSTFIVCILRTYATVQCRTWVCLCFGVGTATRAAALTAFSSCSQHVVIAFFVVSGILSCMIVMDHLRLHCLPLKISDHGCDPKYLMYRRPCIHDVLSMNEKDCFDY